MNGLTNYLRKVKKTLDQIPIEQIGEVVGILHEARLVGRQIFVMGNGGSAATASHFVCDLAKNTQRMGLPSFRAIGLTDNSPIILAYANDEGYEHIFARQLENFIQPHDIVVGISASGNSKNVLNAIELANHCRAVTIGITGYDGGALGAMVQHHINIPCDKIEIVEDAHLMVAHMISHRLRELTQSEFKLQPVSLEFQEAQIDSVPSLADDLFSKQVLDRNLQPNEVSAKELLVDISDNLAANLNLHHLLSRILQLTLNVTKASSGSIVVLDDAGAVIDGALAVSGKVEDAPTGRMEEVQKQGLAGWVAKHRRAALVESTQEDPRWLKREWDNSENRSALSVPLMTQDRVVGVVTLVHPEPGWFTMEDMALLTTICISISYSFKSKQMRVIKGEEGGQ